MNRSILFSIAAVATLACAPESAQDAADDSVQADEKGIAGRPLHIRKAPALDLGAHRAEQAGEKEEIKDEGAGDGKGPSEGLRPDEIDKYCELVPEEPKGCPEFDEGAMEAMPELVALDKACGLWADQGPVVYMADMTVSIGNADFSDSAELKAIVCDGHVADVREVGSGDARKIGDFPSVEQVFFDIGRRVLKGAELVEIAFDPSTGYPTMVVTHEEVKGAPGIVVMKYGVRSND